MRLFSEIGLVGWLTVAALFADGENSLARDVLAGILGLLNTVFAGVLAYMYAKLNAQRLETAELRSREKSQQEMADEAIKAAREMASHLLKKEDKMPLLPLIAAVVSESHSPSTSKQRAEADIATKRAELAAIKLAVGLSPRVEPERSIEPKDKGAP